MIGLWQILCQMSFHMYVLSDCVFVLYNAVNNFIITAYTQFEADGVSKAKEFDLVSWRKH